MKVIFDVLGAAQGSGGPEVHANEMVRAWLEEFPEDVAWVIGPRAFLPDEKRLRRIVWPNASLPARVVGQLLFVPLVMRVHASAALIVSLPVLSPFTPKARSYCFAHDWRHLSNPQEFGRFRRLYRGIWLKSLLRANTVFCSSVKSIRETAALSPKAHLVLATLGEDHPRRWVNDYTGDPLPACVLTFGHRNNKRPELTIRAFAQMVSEAPDSSTRLVVLGATGQYRADLVALAQSLRVGHLCDFPGFIREGDLPAYYLSAVAVVLASSDEGYGLPVAEALYFGAPVLVTKDSGVQEIFGSRITVADPTPTDMSSKLLTLVSNPRATAPGRASTWGENVSVVRNEIGSRQLAQSRRP